MTIISYIYVADVLARELARAAHEGIIGTSSAFRRASGTVRAQTTRLSANLTGWAHTQGISVDDAVTDPDIISALLLVAETLSDDPWNLAPPHGTEWARVQYQIAYNLKRRFYWPRRAMPLGIGPGPHED